MRNFASAAQSEDLLGALVDGRDGPFVFDFLDTFTIVAASRSHFESVGCGTPTSFDNEHADRACGPLNFSTIRFRKATLYSVILLP